MSSHRMFDGPERQFEDGAFEPCSSFDFDDDVSDLGHNMAGLRGFRGEDLDFHLMDGMYEEDDQLEQEFLHGRDVSGSLGFGAQSGVMEPLSAQTSIVNSRSDNVRQQFGQITPPSEVPEPFGAKPSKQPQAKQLRVQENVKLSNEQRARNAANTRHFRAKSTKKKNEPDEANFDDEAAQKQGKNITVQREKNRVAAAKCRAKKKSANEQQEELANEYGATNDYLTREIRELKNQKTELQNFLLAHRPGVCECHGIHDYNIRQAQRLVLNARRHIAEPTGSPSRESAFSTQSPGSEASGSGMFSRPSQLSPPETVGMPSRHSSFSGQMNHAFSQEMDPALYDGTAGEQRLSHEFAEFLQSSPGGRAGFS